MSSFILSRSVFPHALPPPEHAGYWSANEITRLTYIPTQQLANALSQNCGEPMHRELASRAFTDALLKLANDRNTHNQVKAKILERMKEWADMFSKDADLGIMYDAYFRLKQTNPQLQPPSAPQKNSLTDTDRQKEEDELQIALKLSLQEEERKKKAAEPAAAGPSGMASAGPGAAGTGAQETLAPLHPMPSGTTAATVSRVRALYDFVPSEPGELEFKKGDVIAVLESVYKDWWRGSLKGKTGIFPLNYVEKLTDPTPDELQREAQMEAEVFAEIKNVEKLLTLLSTNSAPREEDSEEISVRSRRESMLDWGIRTDMWCTETLPPDIGDQAKAHQVDREVLAKEG